MKVDKFRGSMTLVGMVLSSLEDIITMYGIATVADYYDLIDHVSKYTDSKMGWVSLRKAEIVMTDEEGIYELILPTALPIE